MQTNRLKKWFLLEEENDSLGKAKVRAQEIPIRVKKGSLLTHLNNL